MMFSTVVSAASLMVAVLGVSNPAFAQDRDQGFVQTVGMDFSAYAVPPNLLGKFAARGECASAEGLAHFEQGHLQVGDSPRAPSVYFLNDSPGGNPAIHWAEEGEVSSFEVINDDTLIFRPLGYGMGISIPYLRCKEEKPDSKTNNDGPLTS